MKIYSASILGPKTLLSFLTDSHKEYGDKFQRFNEIAAQKFDRVARIAYIKTQMKGKYSQNFELPCSVFAAIMLKKTLRAFQEPEFNRKEFLQDIRYKSKEILAKNNFSQGIASRFFDAVSYALNDPQRLFELFQHNYPYIYELVNMVCGKKTKQFQIVEHYNAEEMSKIGAAFKQKIFLINYDENKDALENIPIDYKSVYLLKAKGFYFLLIKLQQISAIRMGSLSHEELASIFEIKHKLENEVVKQSIVQTTQDLIPSPSKIRQSPKGENLSGLQINLFTNKLNPPPLSYINTTTVSVLKSSSLFPEEVKCKVCCKLLSEFNSLYWNYANYCLECVVNPKVDISFVPTSIIKKYLKSMKYDTNSPYSVVCPECQSEGSIKNYRVEDKPREYKCRSCLKVICIEHQQISVQCFCFCIKCNKQTISIESLFQKYCATCKTRYCQLCSTKGINQCQCMCKKCGGVSLLDHECKQCCHGCRGVQMTLMDCACGLKLCPMCFFKSLEPNEVICGKNL